MSAYAECYAEPIETIDGTTRIVRLADRVRRTYLVKEDLWTEHDSLVEALVAHIATLDRAPDVHARALCRCRADRGARFGSAPASPLCSPRIRSAA